LKVPGRDLKGIHFAMDFLSQQNRRLGGEAVDGSGEILATGRKVVVIGGGDTGADCLGTSLRQGAVSVTQLEILPEPPRTRSPSTPWPAWPLMLRLSSSHKEGGARHWNVTTKEFIGRDGAVSALRIADVEWVPAAGGRSAPKEKAGTERIIEADLVLLAMGFVGPGRNRIVDDMGIRCEASGAVARDSRNMTSAPGVFVAGDMTQGASLVVRAMADGRRAAAGIAAWLEERRTRA
jgi:glutamate synthase (NADPH/NADH) small chain